MKHDGPCLDHEEGNIRACNVVVLGTKAVIQLKQVLRQRGRKTSRLIEGHMGVFVSFSDDMRGSILMPCVSKKGFQCRPLT